MYLFCIGSVSMDISFQFLASSCCKCFMQINIKDFLYMPKLVLVYICTPTPSTLTLMHSRFYKSQLENMQESFVSTLYLLFCGAATWQKREYNNLPITLKLFLWPRFMEISSNRNLILYFYIWNMESWQLLIRIWIVKPNKQMKRRRKM